MLFRSPADAYSRPIALVRAPCWRETRGAVAVAQLPVRCDDTLLAVEEEDLVGDAPLQSLQRRAEGGDVVRLGRCRKAQIVPQEGRVRVPEPAYTMRNGGKRHRSHWRTGIYIKLAVCGVRNALIATVQIAAVDPAAAGGICAAAEKPFAHAPQPVVWREKFARR